MDLWRLMNIRLCSFLLIGLLFTACNLPGTSPTIPVATSTEPTKETGTSLPVSTSTPVSILTKQSPASLTLTDNTNCRTGPGTDYERITVIPEGTTVPILARSTDGNHWVVDPPDVSENCWVAAEFGTVSGDPASIPVATPSGSEQASAPGRPGSLFYNYQCDLGSPQEVTTTLNWSDAADNENGYRVYRNDTLIVELAANSEQYVDETTVASGGSLIYSVEAFNDAGPSARRTISFSCQ